MTVEDQAPEIKLGTEGEDGAIEKVQSQGEDNNASLGVADLPESLKAKEKELLQAFHAKTQQMADERKKMESEMTRYKSDAETMYALAEKEWFKQAVEAEKARRSGVSKDLSDEEFEAVKNDKRAFNQLLSLREKAVAENLRSEFKAEFNKLSESQKEVLTNREFDKIASDYGDDFIKANKAGELDKYLDKGFDYETSFKLLKADSGEVARKKADVPKKSGAIEKGGMSSVRGGPVVKAKSLDEAISRALELSAKGVKDFKLQK